MDVCVGASSGACTGAKGEVLGQVTVLVGAQRCRRWDDADKLSLVARAFAPGAVVSHVARAFDVHLSQLYRWRRELGLARNDEAQGFAQVIVQGDACGIGSKPCAIRVRLEQMEVEIAEHAPAALAGAVAVIPVPSNARIWLALGHTDMRRGMRSPALQVQQVLRKDVHAGDLFVFRGRSGSLWKILWHDGLAMSLYSRRLERAGMYGRWRKTERWPYRPRRWPTREDRLAAPQETWRPSRWADDVRDNQDKHRGRQELATRQGKVDENTGF